MRKTNWFAIGILGIVIITTGFYIGQQKNKVVVIDIMKVYKETGIGEAVNQKIRTQQNSYQAKMDTLMQEWQAELKTFEKERNNLSTKEIESRKKMLENKQTQIQQYASVQQKKIEEKKQKLFQNEFSKLNEQVKEFAREKNYKLVVGANNSGNVLFVEDKINITDEFVECLKK